LQAVADPNPNPNPNPNPKKIKDSPPKEKTGGELIKLEGIRKQKDRGENLDMVIGYIFTILGIPKEKIEYQIAGKIFKFCAKDLDLVVGGLWLFRENALNNNSNVKNYEEAIIWMIKWFNESIHKSNWRTWFSQSYKKYDRQNPVSIGKILTELK